MICDICGHELHDFWPSSTTRVRECYPCGIIEVSEDGGPWIKQEPEFK